MQRCQPSQCPHPLHVATAEHLVSEKSLAAYACDISTAKLAEGGNDTVLQVLGMLKSQL